MTDTSWVDGFQKAVAVHLLHCDNTYTNFAATVTPTPRAAHILECGVAAVTEVEQDIEDEAVWDDFDSDRTRAVSYLSAKITCACGEYMAEKVRHEAALDDFLYQITHP